MHHQDPEPTDGAPDPLLNPRRLTALRELDLLAAPPQDNLSRLSRIASQLLGVPLSMLSLISWDRQITAGISGPMGVAGEVIDTPLSHSFCQHVVRADAPFVVPDARLHDLTAGNLAIRDQGIVAYAGVPIRLAGGECVGAFCAGDMAPRDWTKADLDILRDLASLAVDVLELHRSRGDEGMRDALTGLPRRALFTERVAQLIGASEQGEPQAVTVVAVDLMAFRLFNEAWGHEAGDAILTEVARRFAETMGGTESVCRLAGDEFLIASAGIEEPQILIGRLQRAIAEPPIHIAGVEQPVGARFVATQSTPRLSAAELVVDALSALADAKSGGTTNDSPTFAAPAIQRLRVRGAILGAERRGELSVHYQPLHDLTTGRISSLEALLRWDHPLLGAVAPSEFIPVAETTGAIVAIGEWVLRQACYDLAGWRADHAELGLTVAVNVAPEQVRLPSFDAAVGGALAAAGLPPEALALEITERTLLQDRPVERRTIDALQSRGVDLHLDDFGTGYSSLGFLTRFPVDVIKIDQMFIAQLGQDERAGALVAGIVAVAHSMGIKTVAEGIETEDQLAAVTELQCDFGQGFLFARPCPAAEVPLLLARAVAG